jgi:YHS domain-containing protein
MSLFRLLVALVLLSLVGCGNAVAGPSMTSVKPPTPEPKPAASAPASDVKAPGEAQVGDKARCPVSGEDFTVEATSPKSEYEGKTYFFCCGDCKKKFDADPQKYVKKSGPEKS